MNYILTYLVFPLEREKEVEIRCWLDGGHFPNFIDRRNGKIIVLNLSIKLIERFVEQFNITSWECGQDSFPEEYVDLCKTINNVFAHNIEWYFRFSTRESLYQPMETYSRIFDLLSAAYLHDGYKAWRLRYYLSAYCLGRTVKSFRESKYIGDLAMFQSIESLRRTIQSELDEAAEELPITYDPDSVPVADVWVDRNPYTGVIARIYVGWFSASFDHFLCQGNLQRFSEVTPLMNKILHKLGIPRNTESPETINNFIESTSLLKLNQPKWSKQTINQDYGIVSTAVIRYLEWEAPDEVLPLQAVPYAIDRKEHKILLFNVHGCLSDWLSKLNDTSKLRRAYLTYDRIPEYADLYEYMERRIESNISGTNITKKTVRNAYPSYGMSGYYIRVRCFSGLMNIDPNNLPLNQEDIASIVLKYQDDYARLYWAYKDLRGLQLVKRCNRVFYSDTEQEYYDRNLAEKLQRNFEDLFDTYITAKYPHQGRLKKILHPYYLAQILGEEW